MRLFVAAYPAPEAKRHLAAVLPTLAIGQPTAPGRSLRLVRDDQWHLTLVFLGDVPDQQGDAAVAAVAAGTADFSGAAPGPLTVRLGGSGKLGRARFSPVCVGLLGDVAGVRTLADRIRHRLKMARLPYDTRSLKPHLTLARPGDRLPTEAIEADRQCLRAYQGPPWVLTEVHLVSSELGPQPRHTTIGSWQLGR